MNQQNITTHEIFTPDEYFIAVGEHNVNMWQYVLHVALIFRE